MRKTREEKAITLIALIITIVVLLILAVVAINAVTGDGIIQHATNARSDYEKAQAEEESILDGYLTKLEVETLPVKQISEVESKVALNETTKVKDSSGNIVIIPKGFSIVKEEADHVTEGIVIQDETGATTAGSQFVWIPVGSVKDEDGTTKNIELKRYVFNEDGTVNQELTKTEPTDQLKVDPSKEYYFTEGLKNEETINAHAKDIEGFINSVKKYGGYYIGRYEAGDINSTQARDENSSDANTVACIAEKQAYNFVTQSTASELSQNMYSNNNNTNVISDLINSYSWDTALVFIQTFEDLDYSIMTNESSDNTGILKITGTSTLIDGSIDERCNIYDMAGNCYEWTTESIFQLSLTCITRGGHYYEAGPEKVSERSGGDENTAMMSISFRPILYL